MLRFSTVKTDKKGLHLMGWDVGKFFERIRTDANDSLIGLFRAQSPMERPELFHRYEEIPHVYAAVELCKQTNGALGIKAVNDLVVLEVRQLMSATLCSEVKRAAMTMPSTMAAFTGATGTEVIILVSVANGGGHIPSSEPEAEVFYVKAYNSVANVYDAVLPVRITRMTPSLRHDFLLPLDMAPLTNLAAAPFRVIPAESALYKGDDVHEHLLALPEDRNADEMDMTAYQNYERAYGEAAEQVVARLGNFPRNTSTWYKSYVTGMADALFDRGWPEEEAVCHIWRKLQFKDFPGLTEEFTRTIVGATYSEKTAACRKRPKPTQKEPLMQQIIRRMESRYKLRHNIVMGYTEYRPNHTWATPWRPVTDKVINTFTTDLQIAGLNVWDRDVKRYINSTRIRNFNPIDDYLFSKCGKWDGRDHIRQLAATVPTENPTQWTEWFHTWFLAMVAQWMGRNRRYGNSIAPLLISEQGMHKSAFCRSLLPPGLRSWGYTDNLSLSEERSVHLAMAQMLLINLDEFNRISPTKQTAFLKNILQLPSVKVKRPYASHTEDLPRLASFIGTTNMPDVLTDLTGSRRFIGIQVTGCIDVSQTPNYTQLYAQAQTELDDGARYWFDDNETAAIMEHNRHFEQPDSSELFFRQYFRIPANEKEGGKWITTTAILQHIKQQAGSAFHVPSAKSFGHTLRNLPGIQFRRGREGSQFYVCTIK